MKLGTEKTGVMVKKLKICLLVSTEYTKVTDRQTDGHRTLAPGGARRSCSRNQAEII